MANRFPLIFNSGAGQIQELAASDNLDLTSSNLVNAGILFTSSGSATAPSLQIGSGTTYNPGLYSPGTDQLAVSTAGVQRINIEADGDINIDGGGVFYDATNNRLAIGTTTVNADLHVYDSAGDAEIRITSNTANQAILRFGNTVDQTLGSIRFDSPTDSFQFYGNNDTERLRIDSSGRLGIGSSSPAQLLHVQKDQAAVTFARFDNQSNNSSAYAGIQLGAFGNTWGIACGSSSANSNALVFVLDPNTSISAGEKMRIDSSGRLLVGTSSTFSSGDFKAFFAGDSNSNNGGVIIGRFQNTSGGVPSFELIKSRGASVGTNTVVQSGDELGSIRFKGADGTNYINAAEIRCDVDGTPGANDMPGRIVFSTTPDNQSPFTGPVERMRIKANGDVSIVTGNLIIGTAGKGIDFSADGNAAGMTSELLDDYEEGTWTPNIDSGYNTSNTVTYTAQSGSYTKIGRLVVAAFHIDIATWSGNAGPVWFGGLPFTPATTTDARFQCAAYLSGPNTPASTVSVNLGYARADNGIYYLVFNCIRDDTSMANAGQLIGGDFAANDVVAGTFTFFV